MNKVSYSKNGGTWFALLEEKVITFKSKVGRLHDEFHWRIVSSVEADSFGDLLIKMGDKGWIDLINKNE
jgi:hypothetical protein